MNGWVNGRKENKEGQIMDRRADEGWMGRWMEGRKDR